MEPHKNLRLLCCISLCIVFAISPARSRLAPTTSPAPSPSDDNIIPLDSDQSYSFISNPPESIAPVAEEVADSESSVLETEGESVIASLSSKLQSAGGGGKKNGEIKKICRNTDHPELCMATVVPLLKGHPNVESILQVAVQASYELSKQGLSITKKLAGQPGTRPEILSTLKDCQDGYDTVVYNYEKTIGAFGIHDIGTMRSMLSASITFVNDCEEEFIEMQETSPVANLAAKLIEMTSNCLAISELLLK